MSRVKKMEKTRKGKEIEQRKELKKVPIGKKRMRNQYSIEERRGKEMEKGRKESMEQW